MPAPDLIPAGLFVGLAALDIVYSIRGVPAPNSKHRASRQALFAGGPAANAAAAFAALGGQATLAAVLGRHPLTGAIREDLGRCGVTLTDLSEGSDSEPSLSSVLVDESTGERIVVSGKSARLPAPDFDPALVESSGARIILVDGHLMEAAIAAAQRARERRVPVAFDGGSWKPGTEMLLPWLDVAICSADFQPPGAPAGGTIEYLRDHGVLRGAITRGEGAIQVWNGALTSEIPVPRTKVVDTLGAGDVFHGAFCRLYAAGAAFEESLRYAAKVATFKCGFFGTRAWMREYEAAGGGWSQFSGI